MSLSAPRQRRRDDIVPDDTNDNTNNPLWKLILPILRQCLCRLLTGRRMTTRTRNNRTRNRRQQLIFAVVLRRILFVFCFLLLYYTLHNQLEKKIIENNNSYYGDNNETMMMMQRNINRQKEKQHYEKMSIKPDTKPSSIHSTSVPLTTRNDLSLYLTTELLMDAVADTTTDNDKVTSTNLTLEEARKGREHVLSILEDAGIDINGSNPIDVMRLPMWNSVTNLYYNSNSNSNSKNQNNSNRSFLTDDIYAAITDNDDDNIDNHGPVIVGLETCEIFRKRVKPVDRFLGIAGNFNSGTTAFATTLQNNCHLPGHNNNKNSFIMKEKDIKNSNGILSQVPWRKHKMADYRDMYIIKSNNGNTGNSNHTTTTTNSNNNNNTGMLKGENVLPIVLIRDPFHWMQSMCKEGYGVRWDHDSKYHCPNLIPNEYDKRRYNQDNWYKYNNTRTKTKKKQDDITATNSPSSIQVWMGPNPQVGPSWPSLIHYWNEWYESYLFHNINNLNGDGDGDENKDEESSSSSYWPRIIIRFEDTLFYPRQVIEKVCHCGGGTLITNSKNGSNNNSTNNGKTITQGSNSNNNGFIYNINESKPNHNNNIEHNNFITAIIKYGGTNNNNDSKRVQNMTLDDIRFAVKTVNPKLMNIFQYTYPTVRTVPKMI